MAPSTVGLHCSTSWRVSSLSARWQLPFLIAGLQVQCCQSATQRDVWLLAFWVTFQDWIRQPRRWNDLGGAEEAGETGAYAILCVWIPFFAVHGVKWARLSCFSLCAGCRLRTSRPSVHSSERSSEKQAGVDFAVGMRKCYRGNQLDTDNSGKVVARSVGHWSRIAVWTALLLLTWLGKRCSSPTCVTAIIQTKWHMFPCRTGVFGRNGKLSNKLRDWWVLTNCWNSRSRNNYQDRVQKTYAKRRHGVPRLELNPAACEATFLLCSYVQFGALALGGRQNRQHFLGYIACKQKIQQTCRLRRDVP